jgi:hypothetical protein
MAVEIVKRAHALAMHYERLTVKCGLLTPSLTRAHEGARSRVNSPRKTQRDVGTKRNVEGDTKFLAEVLEDSLVGDQPVATRSESPPC